MERRDFAAQVPSAATLDEKLKSPPIIADERPGSPLLAPEAQGRPVGQSIADGLAQAAFGQYRALALKFFQHLFKFLHQRDGFSLAQSPPSGRGFCQLHRSRPGKAQGRPAILGFALDLVEFFVKSQDPVGQDRIFILGFEKVTA